MLLEACQDPAEAYDDVDADNEGARGARRKIQGPWESATQSKVPVGCFGGRIDVQKGLYMSYKRDGCRRAVASPC